MCFTENGNNKASTPKSQGTTYESLSETSNTNASAHGDSDTTY